MKKLITICLLLATALTTTAQDKPTKEETLIFMKRTLEAANGSKTPFGTLKEVKFSVNPFYPTSLFSVRKPQNSLYDCFVDGWKLSS